MLKRRVFLRNVKLHVRCGVYAQERELGVEVLVNILVESLEFVDYQKLYYILNDVASEQFRYLEDFLEKVLEKIKKVWEIEFAILRAEKLSLPFQNSMESAGVEVEWRK